VNQTASATAEAKIFVLNEIRLGKSLPMIFTIRRTMKSNIRRWPNFSGRCLSDGRRTSTSPGTPLT